MQTEPIAWFVAGGISALVVARFVSRWVFRHWWLLLGAAFLGAVALVSGRGLRVQDWLPVLTHAFGL